jgi:hypothetical protein
MNNFAHEKWEEGFVEVRVKETRERWTWRQRLRGPGMVVVVVDFVKGDTGDSENKEETT